MLNIALFGPPGAGKGTQSKKLVEKYNLTYISTGDILRQEIAEGTQLGLKAKSIIDQGGLVSDEIIVQIIERRILMDSETNGILFDGFPRTTVQAYILEGLLQNLNTSLSCMLSLEVPKEELMRRMLERSKISGRSDDTNEVIQRRLEEYENKTVPVIDFYREKRKYFPINGVGNMDEIFGRLTNTIDVTLEKQWMNVVLSGPPGAGKGTQGKYLANKYNLFYISTGSLLRREVRNKTEIGKFVEPFMELGEIVPDEIAIKLIEQEIKMHPNVNGFIFKGFPRTIVQAYILDGLLKRMVGSPVSHAIELELPTLESIKRLDTRGRTDRGRSYDVTAELIVNRLEEYEEKTAKVTEFYERQNILTKVSGKGGETEVSERLSHAVEKALRLVR